MTIITNKYTLSFVLLILIGIFFYAAYGYVSDVEDISTSTLDENTEVVNEKNDNIDFLKDMEDNAVNGIEFFVEYRLQRDRVRSKQIELLQQIVENPNSVAETRQEAQQKLLNITTHLEQELQLENMIIAKGYKDTVIFIQPAQVVCVINKKELSKQDVTIIADILMNTTEQKEENIIIIPKG